MLNITSAALKICSETVRQLQPPNYIKCLRLLEDDNGVAISFECPRSSDEIVRHNGNAILAIPFKSVTALSDLTLDVEDDGRFVLTQS